MVAQRRTSTPDFVRVDAAVPTPWLTSGDLNVVHLGQSAVILAHRGGQLVVTAGDFGLAPGGMQLLPSDLARIRTDLQTGTTGFTHWRPPVVEPVDLRIRSLRVDVAAVSVLRHALVGRTHIGVMNSQAQRSTAPALVESALAEEPVAGTLFRLIGAGPGSTPAGDDVVVGVLAGLLALGHDGAATAIGTAIRPLLGRTTSAARHYLMAAIDGRFAERVHLLVRGLADQPRAWAGARAARSWGATSGMDLLAGVIAVADALPHSHRRTA